MLKFLGKKIRGLFKGPIDEDTLEQLEQLFYEADLGGSTSAKLAEKVRELSKKHRTVSTQEILDHLKKELVEELHAIPVPSKQIASPQVILIVGVNGNGKTTSVAKLANHFQKQGKKVLIAAADTFRAAAIDQLQRWSEKMGTTLVKGKHGSDAAAVVFDAVEAAKSRGYDIVLVDTAGRLHTKTDLMQELEKIKRVSDKALPGAPHETYLVLDANIGQNGIDQAVIFNQFTPLTGLILTKLDGTAKGGSAIAIQNKLQIPIKYIGTGETLEAFSPFQADKFIEEMFA